MQPSTHILGRKSSARKHARRPQGRRARPVSARTTRARVAEAFRRMAHGVGDKAAYAAAVRFYRSGEQEWAKQLA
jgi:hypothetical protein